jgi:Fe-S cluster assembly protein SufD
MSSARLDSELLLNALDVLPKDRLDATRRAAAGRFVQSNFPDVGQEDWKYTSLAGAAEISNEWLGGLVAGDLPGEAPTPGPDTSALEKQLDAHWLIIRNGVCLSNLDLLGEQSGLRVERLDPKDLEQTTSDDALSLFNAALLRDGLHIAVPAKRQIDKPLVILSVDDPSNAVSQTRLMIDLRQESRLQVVELNLSARPGRQFTNSVVRASVAPSAALDYLRIQNRDTLHTGVSRFEATLSGDAALAHNSFDLGGALSRNDTIADIRGPGATVAMHGLYLASGQQHIDNHTAILHGVGPATSHEEYRGILAGNARCVFNGKVVVAEGADGTDSSQTNHNLLLSDRAEIDTKPELEIYADDVKCAHGATVGQLDETALFYLRSRGLGKQQARQVITRAFAAELLSRLAVPAAIDYLAQLLDARLESLVGEHQ